MIFLYIKIQFKYFFWLLCSSIRSDSSFAGRRKIGVSDEEYSRKPFLRLSKPSYSTSETWTKKKIRIFLFITPSFSPFLAGPQWYGHAAFDRQSSSPRSATHLQRTRIDTIMDAEGVENETGESRLIYHYIVLCGSVAIASDKYSLKLHDLRFRQA